MVYYLLFSVAGKYSKPIMAAAQQHTEAELAELKKRRTFRKYAYRGIDLEQLLGMTQLVGLIFYKVLPNSCFLCSARL